MKAIWLSSGMKNDFQSPNFEIIMRTRSEHLFSYHTSQRMLFHTFYIHFKGKHPIIPTKTRYIKIQICIEMINSDSVESAMYIRRIPRYIANLHLTISGLKKLSKRTNLIRLIWSCCLGIAVHTSRISTFTPLDLDSKWPIDQTHSMQLHRLVCKVVDT